ncbi:MAG: L,D-transpeptidase [Gammaproteobacteria bacterium]|nr:L,D-transpeptidase [Gammaproteobacteria bacterium]
MLWETLHSQLVSQFPGHAALADQRPFICIDCQQQQLYFVDIDAEYSRSYPISTATKGLGNLIDSQKTPYGIHQIKEKIGGGQAKGMVFKGRVPTGRIADTNNMREMDEITSRILWLDGMEVGVNKGGANDSYERFIYIHGTSDEKRIGQPVSIGCVRMLNSDIIELFDEVLVNDLVLILSR